jgi:hypothetical protein
MSTSHVVRHERLLSIGFRRGLVVAIYGSFLVYAVLRFAQPQEEWIWFAGLGFFVIALVAAIALFYRTPYYNWGNGPDVQLDERERRTRNHYFRVAFNAYVSIVSGALAYASMAVVKSWWLPRTHDEISALVVPSILLAWTLPSALLAWNASPSPDE